MAARSEIQTFYQRIKADKPTFEVRQEGTESICTLQLPAVTLDGGGAAFLEQRFTGRGRNKKLAIAQAAEEGLNFLKEQPSFQSFQPAALLWEAVQKLVSNQGIRKEPEFEGHVLLAPQFNDGWLPVQLLLTARRVSQWAYQHLPAAMEDPQAFLEHISKHLASKAMPAAVESELEASSDFRCIRRREVYKGREGFDIVTAFKATLDHANGRKFKCTLIPAGNSMSIQEVEMEGGGCYWQGLASALGVSAQDLLYWDKFGRNKELYLKPEDKPDDMDDPNLMAILRTFLGPEPCNRGRTAGDCGPADDGQAASVKNSAAADGEEAKGEADAGSSSRRHLTEVRQPVMYSGPVGSRSLNQRASWLMGRQVHGDALVSYCRLRPCEWRTPSVKWASFPLPLFWAWAGAGMPGPEYAHKCNMPLIATLPHTYRSVRGWNGTSPTDMLTQHIPAAICTSGPDFRCQAMSDDPDAAWECTAAVGVAGDGQPLVAEVSDCPSQDAARQHAALALLHAFQSRFCQILQQGEVKEFCSTQRDVAEELVLLEAGEGEVPSAGALLKLEYKVTGSEGQFAGQVLSEGTGRMEWGSGCVIPQVEALITAVRPGGAASCSLALPLDLHNPLVSHGVRCRLEVKSDQKVRFAGTAQAGKDLFVPLMSTQRCESMAALLKQHEAQTVLDVGCGAGRLVEHLLKQVKEGNLHLKKIVGIDLDGAAVTRAAKRICTRNSDIFAGKAAPQLELFQADVACEAASFPEAWGSFVGVDAAVFQEVVEHLDPAPLGWLGPCLLAALQPRLLLLSTPNAEYNPVLHHLQSQALANGKRNSDHRFEWTRAEFQEFCDRLAEAHGYSVVYQGLGQAAEAARAFADTSTSFFGKDLGYSTQVAIFERQSEGASSGTGQHNFERIFSSKEFLSGAQQAEAAGKIGQVHNPAGNGSTQNAAISGLKCEGVDGTDMGIDRAKRLCLPKDNMK